MTPVENARREICFACMILSLYQNFARVAMWSIQNIHYSERILTRRNHASEP